METMTSVRIVETVTASDMASLRQRRDAVADADIIELRLDGVHDVDVAGALSGCAKPIVVTCRPVWEGGAFDGAEETRRRIINQAVTLGADYVDVERRAGWRPEVAGSRTRLILSDHDFTRVPADAAGRVDAMRREQPHIVKLSAMAQSANDCLVLRDAGGGHPSTVVIGMGPYGRITRVLPSRFGSCWTYAGAAAPGQYPADELARHFRVRAVTAATRIYAVTGRPLDHSASPAMHNAAFQAVGVDAVYVPLQAVSVEDAAGVANSLNIAGMSVTAPFKRGWPVICDDEASRALGTVNTLKIDGARWLGRNVDGDGFLDALDARGIDLAAKHAIVLGAGGAARSVGRALIGRGSAVTFCARRHEEAARLAACLGGSALPWPPEGDWDMLVNATPLGTWPDAGVSPLASSEARAALVYDLVYNPEDTALLRAARAAGAEVIGGLAMLVGQAVRQCAWWTGHTPSAAVMTEAARRWLSAHSIHVPQGAQ